MRVGVDLHLEPPTAPVLEVAQVDPRAGVLGVPCVFRRLLVPPRLVDVAEGLCELHRLQDKLRDVTGGHDAEGRTTALRQLPHDRRVGVGGVRICEDGTDT